MTVIPFPQGSSSNLLMTQLSAAWLAEADRHLIDNTWMWPEGAPGWVVDSWAKFIINYRNFSEFCPPDHPDEADWPSLWQHFVGVWLSHQPEWKRAVEISLAEPENAA